MTLNHLGGIETPQVIVEEYLILKITKVPKNTRLFWKKIMIYHGIANHLQLATSW